MSETTAPVVAAGQQVTPHSRTVTQEEINRYAEASGDLNPLHLDADFARSAGLPGAIAHGLLEMGILADAVTRWAGPDARLQRLECRFSKPLVSGDTITCTGTVVSVDDEKGLATLSLQAESSRGERVLSNGRAVVRFSR
ncbi:MAG TPA: MaoC/PaaZ C-terminal domain-containing protein [Candidatus Dormibacteraeota bacterium]|nr:MaoC/PaaZ C-terminal domain-containing protein [Candidatus Dormibacteraeota bacterium]